MEPTQHAPQKADVKDNSYLAIMIVVVLLIAVALWQFYSLMQGTF